MPFPVPAARPEGTPVVPFPSPATISLLKLVCHHKPMVELLPMPCPQHPVSTRIWCCAGTGFTDSFPYACQFQPFLLPSHSVAALHCIRLFFWGYARHIPGFSSSFCSSQHGLNISTFTELILAPIKLEFDILEASALFPEERR